MGTSSGSRPCMPHFDTRSESGSARRPWAWSPPSEGWSIVRSCCGPGMRPAPLVLLQARTATHTVESRLRARSAQQNELLAQAGTSGRGRPACLRMVVPFPLPIHGTSDHELDLENHVHDLASGPLRAAMRCLVWRVCVACGPCGVWVCGHSTLIMTAWQCARDEFISPRSSRAE